MYCSIETLMFQTVQQMIVLEQFERLNSDIKHVKVEFDDKTNGNNFVAKTSETFSKQKGCVPMSTVSNSFQQNAPYEINQLLLMLSWAVSIQKSYQ